jgi:hypothetical protein
MTSREKDDIKEFLTKDNERFKFVSLGLFVSIEDELKRICLNPEYEPSVNESFDDWKNRILNKFYTDKKFSTFFKNNLGNEYLEKGTKSLISARLREAFEHSPREEVDKYLAENKDTVSYALSPDIFESIYEKQICCSPVVSTLSDLQNLCKAVVKDNFPSKEPYIISRLKDNDNFYWSKVYKRLHPLTAGFTYQISGTSFIDIISDIWSDTCCTLNVAVVENRLQQPVCARDIISYAVGIIKNKNKELLRGRKKLPKIDIDTVTYKLTEEDNHSFFNLQETLPSNFPSQNEVISNYIDIDDEDNVRNYMVLVLYNDKHPLHLRLVKGMEDKVKLLFEHYVDDLSYEEIVTKHYGEVTQEEMIRHAARIRQDVKRVKERLINRFRTIITPVK